jgi:hypothetical protein
MDDVPIDECDELIVAAPIIPFLKDHSLHLTIVGIVFGNGLR